MGNDIPVDTTCHSDDRREEDELLRARPKNLDNIHMGTPPCEGGQGDVPSEKNIIQD